MATVFLISPIVEYDSSQQASLVVELNQGKGNPAIPVTTALSTCAPDGNGTPMPTPDINRDGKLDLIFGCPGFVAVMLGNGDGSFQAATTYPILGEASVASTDLNGDGYPDVVAATQTSVSVFLNEGAANPGALLNAVNYAVGLEFGLVTGDFNGDGKQDVVTAQSVLYGNGDGTLQAPQTIPIAMFGGGPWVAADFNADGLTDLAYVDVSDHVSSPALHVLLGSTNGTFAAKTPMPVLSRFAVDALLPPLVINNGSGKSLDLAFVNGNVTLFQNDGQGNFTLGSAYAMTGFPAIPAPDSDGRSDLLIDWSTSLFTLTNNGDGTFNGAPPSLGVGQLSGAAGLALASIVDLNNDGLTDLLWIDGSGELGTSLSLGNGTFSPLMETGTGPYGMVASGDFNGDGNADAVAITDGSGITGAIPAQDSTLFFYAGNGDGSFQAAGSGVDLQTTGAMNEVTGDFNGDGKLDVVFVEGRASSQTPEPYLGGLMMLPGNGDGTFGAPVAVTPEAYFSSAVLFVSDLNNDGKPDLIWNGSVYLNSGNGTFTATGADSLLSSALAFGDLNGDGIPDLVAAGNFAANVYAGNGDGTFQNTPFYTALDSTFMGVANAFTPAAAWIGDVNGDGHSDLVLACVGSPAVVNGPDGGVDISLSDGKGSLVEDPIAYYAGGLGPNLGANSAVGGLARVNSQAPAPGGDGKLDLVVYSNSGFTSLLNQLNPAPTGPVPLPSRTSLASSSVSPAVNQQITLTATVSGASPTGMVTFVSGSMTLGMGTISGGTATLEYAFAAGGSYPVVANYDGDNLNTASSSSAVTIVVEPGPSTTTLSASATSVNENQQVMLTAAVTGMNPTGTVTFVSGSTTLGTAAVSDGSAVLNYSFKTAGNYTVAANYGGDGSNQASSSSGVAIMVAAPDFAIAASTTTLSVMPGQSATTALTITPSGGYSGTVSFTCAGLPSEATCTFSPTTVNAAGGAVKTTLTISTTAATSALREGVGGAASGIALAGVFGLIFLPGRMRRCRRWLAAGVFLPLLLGGAMSISGCGGGSSAPKNPGTPAGNSTVTVTASDASGSPTHTTMIQLTVQ